MAKQRQPFDATGTFVAARSFTFKGVTYASGNEFPWQSGAMGQRQAHKLYLQGLLEMKSTKAKAKAVVETPKPAVEAFVFDPSTHTVHMGMRGPATIVDAHGKVVKQVGRKEGKRLTGVYDPTPVADED